MNEQKSPLGIVAAIAVVTSMGCCIIFVFAIWHQMNPIPWKSGDSLTWDGLIASLATLCAAVIAGGVAAWVLSRQNAYQVELQRRAYSEQAELQRNANAHQADLHRKAVEAQQEEARKAREIQAAADLAEHIDTKWLVFSTWIDAQNELTSTHIPVEQKPHLRRLTDIWIAQLREETIEKSGASRGEIRNAILTFAGAMEWSGIHAQLWAEGREITSTGPEGLMHIPAVEVWRGQGDLWKVSAQITAMASSSDARKIEFLQELVNLDKSYGWFYYDVPKYSRPTSPPDV